MPERKRFSFVDPFPNVGTGGNYLEMSNLCVCSSCTAANRELKNILKVKSIFKMVADYSRRIFLKTKKRYFAKLFENYNTQQVIKQRAKEL